MERPDRGIEDASAGKAKSFNLFAYQHAAKAYYTSMPVQVGVAILICVNFVSNIIEKEIDPDGDKHTHGFGILEYMFNIVFLIELLLNMYGHWFVLFWKDAWNWFDFIVVSIGLIMMVELPLPKSFNLLRTMRAFRVFRLFRRVKSLNKILVAILLAVPGVLNAFLILTIVMCIYAILGVEFFKDVGDGCNDPGNVLTDDLHTNRNNCLGREYFGTFSRSLFSFFQVMTGDSWAEIIARPVMESYGSTPLLGLGSALYFTSFVLVTVMVLVNVVVAVLLDKMVDPEIDVEDMSDDAEVEGCQEPETVMEGIRQSCKRMSVASMEIDEKCQGNRQSECTAASSSDKHEQQPRHGNTLHSRMSSIERQLRDLRKDSGSMHTDLRIIQGQLDLILGKLGLAEDVDPPMVSEAYESKEAFADDTTPTTLTKVFPQSL